MGTFLSIMGAALVITIGIGGLGMLLVFIFDNKKYREAIKKITH